MKVIILLLSTAIIGTVSCCETDPKHQEFFCRNWEKLKDGDFKDYKSLSAYMAGTKNQILNEDFFDNKLTHLESISIKGGDITFENNVFKGLKKLKLLEFSDMDRKFIVKEGIFGNTGIAVFTLNNAITNLVPNAFENMPNAHQAWIMRNNLSTIKNHVFRNTLFKMIYLGNNKIQHIEDGAFLNMSHLGYLDLSNNLLKTLNTEAILGKSLSLEVLIMDTNKLTEISEKMLKVLPNLEVFNASDNSIKTLENGCFANENLWLVDISKNRIEMLPDDILSKKNTLECFYINDNYLQYISKGLQDKLSYLYDISLSGNRWQCKCLDDIKSWMKEKVIENMCEVDTNYCIMKSQCGYVYDLEEIKSNYETGSDCYVPDWRVLAKKRHLKQKKQ